MTDAAQRLTAADRYRIERELGAGGMAMVYLAQDVRHDRRVALKVLRPVHHAARGPWLTMSGVEYARARRLGR